jgi:hypothetical protein
MAAHDGDAPLRLFESDLTSKVGGIVFNGKSYPMNTQITAYGGFACQMTDVVSVYTEHSKPSACADHFRKLMTRFPDLKHGDEQMRRHILVIACHDRIIIQ